MKYRAFSTGHHLPLRTALPIFRALFILTGCAGLLAEQCFEKLLQPLVGASTPAAAIVLAVYFLGLTLGNWLYGWRLAGRGSPLKIYAALELGVALWALALISLAAPLVSALTPLLRLGLEHFWLLQGLFHDRIAALRHICFLLGEPWASG